MHNLSWHIEIVIKDTTVWKVTVEEIKGVLFGGFFSPHFRALCNLISPHPVGTRVNRAFEFWGKITLSLWANTSYFAAASSLNVAAENILAVIQYFLNLLPLWNASEGTLKPGFFFLFFPPPCGHRCCYDEEQISFMVHLHAMGHVKLQ